MAGVSIEVHFDDTEIKAALNRLAHHAENMEPAFRQMGEYLQRVTNERFEAQQAPDGSAWEPLSEVTLKRRAKRGKGNHILVESGHLRNLLRYQFTKQGLEFGSDRVYAAALQFGMKKGYAGTNKNGRPIPWGDIPARPFLGLNADDKTEMIRLLETHLAS